MRTLASGQAARLSIWRTRVRIPPSLPCVPLVQWITTRVYETRDSGSSPERDAKFLGVSSSGQDGALSMPRRGFDSPRARQVRPSQLDIRQPLTRMLDGGRFGAGKLIR
jgi:hypothetical protein